MCATGHRSVGRTNAHRDTAKAVLVYDHSSFVVRCHQLSIAAGKIEHRTDKCSIKAAAVHLVACDLKAICKLRRELGPERCARETVHRRLLRWCDLHATDGSHRIDRGVDANRNGCYEHGQPIAR